MQALSARHRCFAFDFWGFGDSSKGEDLYTVSHYTEMIDQFVDQLGIMKPVTLVGHSLGAAVALRYATEQTDSVDKLISVAMPLAGADINSRLTDSDPGAFIAKVMGKANSFAEIDSEIRKTDQVAMNRLASELSTHDFAADLEKCTRPVLTIFGEQDTVVQPPMNAQHLLQNADFSRFFVSLNECSHFPMLQEKAKFNRLLMDFIHADESLTELTPKEYWQRRIR
jgi:pimeloyl-ACP methyl ester carboxylesterase